MLCRETHLLCYYFLPQSHSLNIAAAALHPRCRIKLIACHFWCCLQCPFIGIFVQWQTFWSCLSNEQPVFWRKGKTWRKKRRKKEVHQQVTPRTLVVFPREEPTSSHAFLFGKLQTPTDLSEISLFHCYIPSLEAFDVTFCRFFWEPLVAPKGFTEG